MSIINNALRIIRKVYKTDIDLSTLPLDDEETYKLFQRGDTTGVFQLESAGMKRYLRDLKPSVFEDIIAMVALYARADAVYRLIHQAQARRRRNHLLAPRYGKLAEEYVRHLGLSGAVYADFQRVVWLYRWPSRHPA
ncbi:hypothetical protein GWK76_03125 [Candidatus Saccharibacteria bacterium oral taxon 488]|nr:hypothetical protein GWK76_03125 [Candidatus Saccharibacteria bacterium oral taxon 488]